MDDEEDPDIAEMMGFGAFGGTKKRKFDQTNSPKSKIDASGANSTQLGVRPKLSPDGQSHNRHVTDDAFLASTTTNEAQTQSQAQTSKGKGKLKKPEATGLASFLARAQTLPEKPPSSEQSAQPSTQDASAQETNTATFSYGGPPITEAELYALRRGVKDGNGDTVYFLPSFVEDPWEKLEHRRR